jgi:hypothetical protein
MASKYSHWENITKKNFYPSVGIRSLNMNRKLVAKLGQFLISKEELTALYKVNQHRYRFLGVVN